MKVGFVITTHNSKLNPDGNKDTNEFIKSIVECVNYNYEIILIDNTSIPKYSDVHSTENSNYTFVEDQTLTGMTGAWNLGINIAIASGCDIINNCNNDLIFNSSINGYIKKIAACPLKDDFIFGPLTNRGGAPGHFQERCNTIKNQESEVTGRRIGLNGFMMSFYKEFYLKHNMNGFLFSTDKKYIWDAQEHELRHRLRGKGVREFVIHDAMVFHKKRRNWLKAKEETTGINRPYWSSEWEIK